MTTKLVLLPLLALFLAATPAVAADTAAASTAKLDPKDPDAIKCRRLEVTGSLVKKERICKTNAQWKEIGEQQRREGSDLIERSRSGMNPNSG